MRQLFQLFEAELGLAALHEQGSDHPPSTVCRHASKLQLSQELQPCFLLIGRRCTVQGLVSVDPCVASSADFHHLLFCCHAWVPLSSTKFLQSVLSLLKVLTLIGLLTLKVTEPIPVARLRTAFSRQPCWDDPSSYGVLSAD